MLTPETYRLFEKFDELEKAFEYHELAIERLKEQADKLAKEWEEEYAKANSSNRC